jgi:hypothetical protein
MQGEKIMQLILILALFLLCGKGENLSEIKPLVEELGDDNLTQAFNRVSDYKEIFDAVADILPQNNNNTNNNNTNNNNTNKAQNNNLNQQQNNTPSQSQTNNAASPANDTEQPIYSAAPPSQKAQEDFFPLSPISNIADRKITYCLSEYFAEQS